MAYDMAAEARTETAELKRARAEEKDAEEKWNQARVKRQRLEEAHNPWLDAAILGTNALPTAIGNIFGAVRHGYLQMFTAPQNSDPILGVGGAKPEGGAKPDGGEGVMVDGGKTQNMYTRWDVAVKKAAADPKFLIEHFREDMLNDGFQKDMRWEKCYTFQAYLVTQRPNWNVASVAERLGFIAQATTSQGKPRNYSGKAGNSGKASNRQGGTQQAGKAENPKNAGSAAGSAASSSGPPGPWHPMVTKIVNLTVAQLQPFFSTDKLFTTYKNAFISRVNGPLAQVFSNWTHQPTWMSVALWKKVLLVKELWTTKGTKSRISRRLLLLLSLDRPTCMALCALGLVMEDPDQSSKEFWDLLVLNFKRVTEGTDFAAGNDKHLAWNLIMNTKINNVSRFGTDTDPEWLSCATTPPACAMLDIFTTIRQAIPQELLEEPWPAQDVPWRHPFTVAKNEDPVVDVGSDPALYTGTVAVQKTATCENFSSFAMQTEEHLAALEQFVDIVLAFSGEWRE